MTKFATAALALCIGFSGLNVAEAAASKPSTATAAKPAAAKPAAAKPAAAPAATKTTTTAFGTGVWRTVETSPPNPVTHVSSGADLYMSFGANAKFEEEIVVEGGDGQTGVGGVIEIFGTDKRLSATSMQFTTTTAELCSIYCEAYEPTTWGKSVDFTYKTLAPGEIQGSGGADWTEIEP